MELKAGSWLLRLFGVGTRWLGRALCVLALAFLATQARALSADAGNLLINGGFEQPLAEEWKTLTLSGSLQRVSSHVQEGSWAARFDIPDSDHLTQGFYQTVSVSPGGTYCLQGYAWNSDAQQVFLRINWLDASRSVIDNSRDSSPIYDKGAWRFLTTGDVAAPQIPRSAHWARVEALVVRAAGASATAYFDEMSFAGPSPPSPTPTETPTPSPTGSIAGQIGLQGRSNHSGALVQLFGYGTACSDTTDTAGNFCIQAPPDNYNVMASMQGYLYAMQTEVAVSGGVTTTLHTVMLIGGDADGDDDIDIHDLMLLAADFGLPVPPGDSRADINGDGIVNIFDLVLVGTSYGLMSPPPWPEVAAGHLLERRADAFIDNPHPSPGASFELSTAPGPSPNSTPTLAEPGDIIITEVLYDPPQSGGGVEASYEWLEIQNTTSHPLTLAGWSLEDNTAQDIVHSLVVSPGGLAVVAASQSFYEDFPEYGGAIFFVDDGKLGNGLSNESDRLILRDSGGTVIDSLSYGDDDSVSQPPWPRVATGHSLERRVGAFVDNPHPSPGAPPEPATTPGPSPTATPTSTPTNTPTAVPTGTPSATPASTSTATPASTPTLAEAGDIVISEVLYDPLQSGVDAPYEWLELQNTTSYPLTLAGWSLEDNAKQDAIPSLVIPPAGLAVVAASPDFYGDFPDYEGAIVFIEDGELGNGLSNDGDRLILRDGAGKIIDALSYGADYGTSQPPCPLVTAGHSLERRVGAFVDNPNPSPGASAAYTSPTAQASPPPTTSPTEVARPIVGSTAEEATGSSLSLAEAVATATAAAAQRPADPGPSGVPFWVILPSAAILGIFIWFLWPFLRGGRS